MAGTVAFVGQLLLIIGAVGLNLGLRREKSSIMARSIYGEQTALLPGLEVSFT
jgi:hypothetical protein